MKKLLIFLAFCGSAHAEFKSGNELLADMNGDVGNRMYALGYVVGVADMGRGIVNCMPDNATAGQINDMVKNYLTNVPAERHLTADILVNRVLKATWPCAKKGTSL